MYEYDKRSVEFDTRCVGSDKGRRVSIMSTAVQQSAEYLVALARLYHRGHGDTWSAARDRAAKAAGVEPSYAKRIWDRWRTMRDVSGEAYIKLRKAYEELCERNDAAARAYRAERMRLQAERHEIDKEPTSSGLGASASRDREGAEEGTKEWR
jgi:hypothetical protein